VAMLLMLLFYWLVMLMLPSHGAGSLEAKKKHLSLWQQRGWGSVLVLGLHAPNFFRK